VQLLALLRQHQDAAAAGVGLAGKQSAIAANSATMAADIAASLDIRFGSATSCSTSAALRWLLRSPFAA
jgi:hypothetical protein